MAYPTVETGENPATRNTPGFPSAPPTHRERLRAGLVLAGLLSLAAAFWIVVIRLVTMV